ncbi:hypothetical protein PAXRUDRAFT_16809 [Paxillus rubicundulus Ve08.2h10]|uniref:Unplaced genomic scaffold scaffold_1731, whole genome shotgun sequence n=1 Tax=Paxillus rubicundulus Ve08.2h10 TaxID=930991 RepID=A0A0D0C5Z7_9AGAM|nr:hypothetical protein PAXRUDRAFT_16809 [Paxillus rubicundulus Ve08.2h10]
MSSSIANDLTKWSDKQLRENEDDDDELFEKKSVEHRRHTKVQKEVERQMVEEVARRKAEVKAQRRAEAEVKAHAEEVMRAQSSALGPSKGKQPRVTASGTAEVAESVGGLAPYYGCSDAGVACKMRAAGSSKARSCDHCRRLQNKSIPAEEAGGGDVAAGRKEEVTDVEDCKAEENRDALGALVEVLSAMVGEMQNMAVDRRHVAVESHAQMERVLGTLEEGSEEDFEEEEGPG